MVSLSLLPLSLPPLGWIIKKIVTFIFHLYTHFWQTHFQVFDIFFFLQQNKGLLQFYFLVLLVTCLQ